MLKTIKISSNKKLGPIAATYRAGAGNVYSTCPNSCPLKPSGKLASESIDEVYLQALLEAVPEEGVAWTYTHFDRGLIPKPNLDKAETTINISTDTVNEAVDSIQNGYPTVYVRPSTSTERMERLQGVRFVQCPAEYTQVVCASCGGSDGPLCARKDRNYVIAFTAHGAQKKRVDRGEQGGCYGSGGPVHLQWRATAEIREERSDAVVLREFAAGLKPGTIIRHHVLGDLG